MTGFLLLLLALQGVTPSPGWSDPIVVTDSANTQRLSQFISRDSLGRFHLVWAGYNDQHRIAYKIFLIDGTTVYPETMISRDVNSAYLKRTVMEDSLIAFWREYDPVYYAARSLADGSEVTPATYLFTSYTLYPYIRACPDSLGRLHVLYNDGGDVCYAVWTPAPGSGFITEYEWKIEGADAGGVLLVDGNRVHVVVQDPVYHTYEYIQYDLEGNTVIPLTDFTADDIEGCSRFPELNLDTEGNLMVVNHIARSGQEYRYVLWKIDKNTGITLIDEKIIVIGIPPRMYVSVDFILRRLPGLDQYYLCWTDSGKDDQILYMLIDGDGNVLQDWQVAYDYSDEFSENVRSIDGVVDTQGNLYIVYSQVETEPQIDYFPTFGWFDHTYLGIEEEEQSETIVPPSISASCNPVTGSVSFTVTGSSSNELEVYDISGRLIVTLPVSNGVALWNGKDASGERLPYGVYRVSCGYTSTTVILLGD
ncbi:MAG: hypothetical protein JXK93_06630 [Sphaerochaetaceae bacterium]|nr:hypothetical protein [Sphaerochaetaceae bacterium]